LVGGSFWAGVFMFPLLWSSFVGIIRLCLGLSDFAEFDRYWRKPAFGGCPHQSLTEFRTTANVFPLAIISTC
jgi:hypothetical protein